MAASYITMVLPVWSDIQGKSVRATVLKYTKLLTLGAGRYTKKLLATEPNTG